MGENPYFTAVSGIASFASDGNFVERIASFICCVLPFVPTALGRLCWDSVEIADLNCRNQQAVGTKFVWGLINREIALHSASPKLPHVYGARFRR